jgi:ParB-like chromosome segregation protein Spo0J
MFEPLSEFVGMPRNPKAHNLGEIHQSLDRFGFVGVIIVNDVTGHVVAGHGRIEALRQKKVSGERPPEGIEAKQDDWYVPTEHISVPEKEEEALAIALNRIGENEWDNSKTAQILADLAAEDNLEGTGFDGDDVDYLIKLTTPKEGDPISEEELANYRDEKSHWRWLRLHVTEDTYDRWHDLKLDKNDDEFVELLLNLVEDS